MLKRYIIKVTEILTTEESDRSFTDHTYFRASRSYRVETTHDITTTFATFEEARDIIKQLPASYSRSPYTTTYVYALDTIDYTHANHVGYSDVDPYEIVRVVSPKTIELRQVHAELDPNWKPEIVSGGYAGHCTNQHTQKWNYKSNPDGGVIRARMRKDGYFHSAAGRHSLNTEPRKFYDYNF